MNSSENTRVAIELLDLPLKFSRADLNTARKDQLLIWHPDRFNSNERLRRKTEERAKQINHAFDSLQGELRGDLFEWVAQAANGNGSQQSNSDLMRQNRELQQALVELQRQMKEELLSTHKQHACAIQKLAEEHKVREATVRRQIQEDQTALIQRNAILKQAINLLKSEKRRKHVISYYLCNYFVTPTRELVLSIAGLSIKVWTISNEYIKRNVPNTNEQTVVVILIIFLIALSVLVLSFSMPIAFLIVLACLFLIAGAGRILLMNQDSTPGTENAKTKKK